MGLARRHLLAAPLAFAAPAPIKLSLSVRVAEAFDNKERTTKTIDELLGLARTLGFDAICMRASQAGIHSPKSTIAAIGARIKQAGLKVSMITGDFAVPSNNDEGPGCLRNIKPYLDLAEAFSAPLIRVCMKKEEDIVWAQRAADQARERKIRLAHQSHCASLFETVAGSLRTLKMVNRPNFGLIYEPANWFVAGEEYGRATIARFEPWIFNAYIQNHLLRPDAKASLVTWKKGRVAVDHIGVWEKGGVDVEDVFAGLHAIGYTGYMTVHQAFGDIMPVEDAVRKSFHHLKPLCQRG